MKWSSCGTWGVGGRYRTNAWDNVGASEFNASRGDTSRSLLLTHTTATKVDIDRGPPIHPDDIDCDILEGEVLIKGLLTPDERALLKLFNDGVRVAKICLIEACEELKATPRKTVAQKRIIDLTETIHRCNKVLPERYRVEPYAIVLAQGVEL